MTSSSKPQYEVATAIDMGNRDRQEDCLVADFTLGAPVGIAVLADGMGGHNAGEVASSLIVTDIFADLKRNQGTLSKKPGKIPERLRNAVEVANERLQDVMHAKPDLRGMGSTVVATVIVGGSLYWTSVGDSLLFLYRDGKLTRLNQDHSMAPRIDAMVAAGQMPAEEGATHPDRNCLTSAITGKDIPRIDCPNIPYGIDDGDTVLMASDGLQSMSDVEIEDVLAAHLSASGQAIAEALLAGVHDKGVANQDNTSITVIKVGSSLPAKAEMPVNNAPEAVSFGSVDDLAVALVSPGDIEDADDLLNQAIAL